MNLVLKNVYESHQVISESPQETKKKLKELSENLGELKTIMVPEIS